jgi:type I restriction enzyme S subunit
MEKKKNVPVLRFPEFSEDWEKKKLGEVADIKTGPFGSALHQSDYVSEGTPIITVEHLGELGIVHENLPLVSDFDLKRLKSYLLQTNDIVFSRVGSVDRNSRITKSENGWLFSGRLLRIRFDDKIIDSAFVSNLFQKETTKQSIRSVAVGQTMASLNTEILKGIELYLTKLPEQQKIASILTSLDDKLQSLKKKKTLLEQYKKGMMQKIFSQELRFKDDNGASFPKWEKKKLNNLVKIMYGKDQKKVLAENGEYPILGTGGIIGRTNQFLCDKPSVLIGRKGTIDKPVYMDTPFWTVDTLFYTEVFSNTLPKWLYFKFQTINWYLYNEASGVPSLSGSTIYNIKIILPCLEEQTKIANFLSAIDDKINLCNTQIEKTEQWKKGLLQKMFV